MKKSSRCWRGLLNYGCDAPLRSLVSSARLCGLPTSHIIIWLHCTALLLFDRPQQAAVNWLNSVVEKSCDIEKLQGRSKRGLSFAVTTKLCRFMQDCMCHNRYHVWKNNKQNENESRFKSFQTNWGSPFDFGEVGRYIPYVQSATHNYLSKQ